MATNWNEILGNTQSLADVLALQKKILALIGDLATLDSSEIIARIDQIINSSVDDFDEKQIAILKEFQSAIDAAMAASAGEAGWVASLVATKDGKNQQQFNDNVAIELENKADGVFQQPETTNIPRPILNKIQDIQIIDDYLSPQDAFDAKRSSTTDLKIGKKQYVFSKPLSLTAYHHVTGAGFNSDLKFTADGSGLIYTLGTGVQDDHSQRCLSNFQIRGNNTVSGYLDAKTGTTVGYQYTSTGHYSDTYNLLLNGHAVGMKIEKSYTNRNNHNYYRSNKIGLHLKDTTSHREDMIYARYNSDHAVLIEGTTQNVHFSGGAIEGNRGTAITWRSILDEAFPKLILDNTYFESAGDKAANVPAVYIQSHERMHTDVRGGNLWNNELAGVVTGPYKWGNSVSFNGSALNGFHYAKRMRVKDCTDYALYNSDYELSDALLTGLAEPTLMLEYIPVYRDSGIGPVFQVPIAGRFTRYIGATNEATLNYPHILSKSTSVTTSENIALNYGDGNWTDITFSVNGSYNTNYAQLSNIIDTNSEYQSKVFVFLLQPTTDCKIGIISAGSASQNTAYFSLKAGTTYRILCLANRKSAGDFRTRIFSIDGAASLSYLPIFLGKYKRVQDALNVTNMFCLGAV